MAERRLRMNRAILAFCFLMLGFQSARAQMFPERRHIRAGNRDYEAQDYVASEGDYREALEKNPASFEAAFNLGDALFRQQRYEEAAETFRSLTERGDLSSLQLGRTWYNLGNSLFAMQKFPEALEAYKASLRANPDDLEAKYNYAYTKKLLEQNQQNHQSQQNRQDPRNNPDDNSGDSGNDRQNDSGDEPDGGGNDSGKEGDSPEENKPQPSENPEGGISRSEAERLLQAMQQQEDKTREKVDARKAAAVGKSGKNW